MQQFDMAIAAIKELDSRSPQGLADKAPAEGGRHVAV